MITLVELSDLEESTDTIWIRSISVIYLSKFGDIDIEIPLRKYLKRSDIHDCGQDEDDPRDKRDTIGEIH